MLFSAIFPALCVQTFLRSASLSGFWHSAIPTSFSFLEIIGYGIQIIGYIYSDTGYKLQLVLHGFTWSYMQVVLDGYRQLHVVVLHDNRGVYVVIGGYRWLQVVIGGYRWVQVVIGYMWLQVVLHGYRWLYIVIGGFPWLQVVLTDYLPQETA